MFGIVLSALSIFFTPTILLVYVALQVNFTRIGSPLLTPQPTTLLGIQITTPFFAAGI